MTSVNPEPFRTWLLKKKMTMNHLDKLNEYRCTACGTDRLTIIDMRGAVSHPAEDGCCWAGTGCCK